MDRNARIVEEFLQGETDKTLAERYGISDKQVLNIRKDRGIRADDRKKKIKTKSHDVKPLSEYHRKLGVRVSELRNFKYADDYDSFAIKVGLSRDRLVQIERGIRDVTLTDLQKIAMVLGERLDKLVEEP